MSIPHPFPYQGSKRKLAGVITAYIPDGITRLVEPFAGSGAVSIAAVHNEKTQSVLINDVNQPLIALWRNILEAPAALADAYEAIWGAQFEDKKGYYNRIRERFNRTHAPEYLLFLLVRCVKAAVRYNAQGEFNQSPDNRRNGTHPDKMRKQLMRVAGLMAGKTSFAATDYRAILNRVTTEDLVYMDPPYQGVVGKKDPRYYGGVSFEDFVETLDDLNRRGILYIISYDGRTGAKQHGSALPEYLNLQRLGIDAGRSSQATLLGKTSKTVESLYLSPALVEQHPHDCPQPDVMAL